MKFFQIEVNIQKARDTGMAIVLILLLLEIFIETGYFYKIAIPVLVINMTVPQVFYPIAYLWFGLAQLLGTVVSKVLLFIIFAVIVLPVAIIRKMMGKDSLMIKKWKKGTESVFKTRDHLFQAADIDKPY